MLTTKGTPIKEWFDKRIVKDNVVTEIAAANRLTVQAVYKYIESDRDIRVHNGSIYEVKKLEGKQ